MSARWLYCFGSLTQNHLPAVLRLQRDGWVLRSLPKVSGDQIISVDLTEHSDRSFAALAETLASGETLSEASSIISPLTPETERLGLNFRRVPDGLFIGPAGEVWPIQGLHIARFPVTNEQYEAFVADASYDGELECPGLDIYRVYDGLYLQALRSHRPGFCEPEAPVVCVSWRNARAFADHLTQSERGAGRLPAPWRYRLPTEAEWQYSASVGRRSDASSRLPANRDMVVGHPTAAGQYPADDLACSTCWETYLNGVPM